MYNVNLKHILCIYFLLNQNLIIAVTDNNNNNDKALPSNKVHQGRPQLKNGVQYILDVAQEFVYELEEYGFCSFILSDFSQNISQTAYFGRIVKGIIYYKNGFINTVDEIGLQQNPSDGVLDQDKNTAEFTLKLHLLNLMTLFDFTADLTETKFSGTVAIPIANIEFIIQIKKYFFNNYTDHNVTINGLNTGINTVWYYEPSNSYTQVINRFAESINSRLGEDFKSMASNYWNKILGKVIDKIPFPELCLFCEPAKN